MTFPSKSMCLKRVEVYVGELQFIYNACTKTYSNNMDMNKTEQPRHLRMVTNIALLYFVFLLTYIGQANVCFHQQ